MTRSTRLVSMLGTAAALTLGLTACSSDSGSSEYCDLITGAEQDAALVDVDPADAESMGQLSGTIVQIANAAPEDIRGDWETFAASVDSLAAAAAIDPTAAATEPPADGPGEEDIMTAIDNIDQHVQNECDVAMS